MLTATLVNDLLEAVSLERWWIPSRSRSPRKSEHARHAALAMTRRSSMQVMTGAMENSSVPDIPRYYNPLRDPRRPVRERRAPGLPGERMLRCSAGLRRDLNHPSALARRPRVMAGADSEPGAFCKP